MTTSPLTEAQEGLWLARRLDPENPNQNTGQTLRFRGPLNTAHFAEAVDSAIGEADGLRVGIAESEGEPVLHLGAFPPVQTQVIDLSDQADPFAQAMEQIDRDMLLPRDPAQDDPVTSILFRLGAEDHLWYLCIQHLVIDGYGTSLLLSRALDLYRAAVDPAAPKTRPFNPFSEVLNEDASYRGGARREEDRKAWLEALAEVPEVRSLSGGVPLSGHTAHLERRLLPDTFISGVQSISKRAKAGWPDVVVALVAEYLHRHIGGPEVVVGIPIMNRLGSAAARVPAMVMNVVPVRIAPAGKDSTEAFCLRAGATLARARKHGRYRSEELRRELGLLGGGKRLHGPLINVLPFQQLPAIPGVQLQMEVLGAGPVDDLTITFRGGGDGGVYLEVEANPLLYAESEVGAHLERLIHFLEAAVEAPALHSVPTLTPEETRRWIHEVNDTGHPVPDVTLIDLIEAQMRERPDAPALEGEGERLDYREFDRRTAAMAAALQRAGARPGSIVGVFLPRSVRQVVAHLGTVRAGAAYLPLDPDHPPARIESMLAAAGPVAVVTDAGLRHLLPEGVAVVDAETAGEAPVDDPEARAFHRGVAPGDPAYLIFTSGSTGAPKGVLVEHRAIVNRLEWMRTVYAFSPEDRFLQKTPATFDVSVWEFFLPFIVGGTLVVAPPGAHADPAVLARLLREEEITTVHFVPSMLAAFLAHPDSRGVEVRRVFSSGEALPAAVRDRFHATVSGQLHNLYGPTEAAVDVTFWEVGPDDRSDPVPIGRPVWNTKMYILDEALRPVPPGVEGELYIAGRQLARGYHGRPDLTAERFLSDPFGAPGERMYRTGDLGRWRVDGAIVYAGRVDHQVKIRGQRVELGEIESALRTFTEVADAAVLLREDRPGDARLAAYIVARGDAGEIELDNLRSRLGRLLPEVMVPADLVTLEALPLTASGKLDRRALPSPAPRLAPVGPAATTPNEVLVAQLFQELLGLSERPGLNGDFFELGGHSLLAIRLAGAIREATDVDPGPASLFAHPTVGKLALHLDRMAAEIAQGRNGSGRDLGLGPVITLVPPVEASGRSPLYCIHPAGGIAWCYAAMARAIEPGRSVFGVQARGLDPESSLPETLEEMAAGYVREILKQHPGGPVHLAGWSMGGILAQEMAVQLEEGGHRTGLVALLDAYPADRWRDEPDPGEAEAVRALLLMAGEDPDRMAEREWTREGVRLRLREKGHPLGELPESALNSVVRVVASNSRLVRRHRHRPFGGTLLHFRAALDHEGEDLDASHWSGYAESIVAQEIQATHPQMTTQPAAGIIAKVLADALEGWDSTGSSAADGGERSNRKGASTT